MVGSSGKTPLAEVSGALLRLLFTQAVDNAGLILCRQQMAASWTAACFFLTTL